MRRGIEMTEPEAAQIVTAVGFVLECMAPQGGVASRSL